MAAKSTLYIPSALMSAVAANIYFSVSPDIDLNRLSYKINQILPSDILILSYKNVNEDFHARYDAVSRTYEYRITQKKEPFQNGLFNLSLIHI